MHTTTNLLSIIIPIYNIEKYLAACIESAIGQTYSNLEILLIDDGSTDKSGLICDEYAAKDTRIKVIHKQNGGLSDTRNVGIEKAKGEFVFHLDGDDYLDPDAIETLMAKQKDGDHDLVFSDLTRIGDDGNLLISRDYDCEKYTLLNRITGDLAFPHFLAGSLIRRDLYIKHNIKAREGVNFGEDLQVLLQLIYFAKSYAKVDKPVYNYTYSRHDSMTKELTLGRIRQDIASMEIVADFLKQKGESELHDNMLATLLKKMPEWLSILCKNKKHAEYRELLSIANKPELKPFRKALSKPYEILLWIPSPQIASCYLKTLKALA